MFWANAIILNRNTNQLQSLFTYEGSITPEEAKTIIEKWKENENIQVVCAYIKDDNTDQVIYLENNVNVIGQISYENEVTKGTTPKL